MTPFSANGSASISIITWVIILKAYISKTALFVNTLRDSASFRELSRLITLKYLHLPSNLVINIFTLTDVLELKVNLGKYIVYMHYSVYCKLLAARIFAYICKHLRSLAQLIVNKLQTIFDRTQTELFARLELINKSNKLWSKYSKTRQDKTRPLY